MSTYYVAATLHVLAALFWLGGMFFLAAVGAPVLRRLEPPALRAQLFRALGLAFRRAGWVAIAVLVATGAVVLHSRGQLAWSVWTQGWLAIKLWTVAVMILLSGLHDFWVGPAAARAAPGTPQALTLRRWSAWIARGNAALGLLLVVAAVRVARGG